MKIVLDTNCLLPAVFPHSIYHWVWERFRLGAYTMKAEGRKHESAKGRRDER